MIKRFICMVWGHKYREKSFTDYNAATKSYIYRWTDLSSCPRCGDKL